jgi:hypothetical protein
VTHTLDYVPEKCSVGDSLGVGGNEVVVFVGQIYKARAEATEYVFNQSEVSI